MASNYKKANVSGVKPGFKSIAYLAPRSWFTTLAAPDPAGVGDLKYRIVDDHVFIATKGFIELTQIRGKNTAVGESKGTPGAQWMTYKTTLVVPGDNAALQTLLMEIANEDLIVVLPDADCGVVWQFGCACDEALIESMKANMGTQGSDTGKDWTIELASDCRTVYEGTIEVIA